MAFADETDASMTLAGMAATIWAFNNRTLTASPSAAEFNAVNQNLGEVQNAVIQSAANAPELIATEIERPDGPLDNTFKHNDNIKVTVDGVERTGLHEKV